MFVDCCVLKSREWWDPTAVVGVGRRQQPSSIDVRMCMLEELSPPATHHSHVMSLPGQRSTTHNDRFDNKAAEPTAPMRTGTLFLTSSGGKLPPYVFPRRTQPTRAPQYPLMHCDLNGRPMAAMVPHSRRRRTKQSPNMLAD